MSKSVLLIYKNEGLSQVFEKELKKSGYIAYPFYNHPIHWDNFTLYEKFNKIFKKVFFKDNGYVHQLYDNVFKRYNNKQLRSLKKNKATFDFCLVIHGGMIPEDVLQYARSISVKMIDYQPDGLGENNKILEYRSYFDEVFVFDPEDAKRFPYHKLKPTTNFFIEDKFLDECNNEYDLYYIGAHANNRKEILENLNKNLPELNNNFILGISPYSNLKDADGIKYIKRHISFYDNLELAKKAKVLIDLKRPEHNGLSFRFFEALAYGKKVITNNKTVINYDFYHPNNVLITDNFTNYNEIKIFLSIPYFPIEEKISEQYNFKNWIKKMLES